MTTKKRTGVNHRGRTATSTVGVVRIPPSDGGMLLLEAIDSTNVSLHLALEGSRNFRHFEGIETKQDFVLAADIDQDGNFRLSEVAGFLKEISGKGAFLEGPGRHFEAVSLFTLQALRKSGELLEPVELAERAREQRRQAKMTSAAESATPAEMRDRRARGQGEQGAEAASEAPNLDVSGPPVERPRALSPEERRAVIEEEAKANPDDFLHLAYELALPDAQIRFLKSHLQELLTTKEAADRMGVSEVWVNKLAQMGNIGEKVGRNYAVLPQEVEQFNRLRAGGSDS